jgi:hypothetical protein
MRSSSFDAQIGPRVDSAPSTIVRNFVIRNSRPALAITRRSARRRSSG